MSFLSLPFFQALTRNNATVDDAKSVVAMLVMLVKTHILLGTIFVFLATNYSSALVSILGGKTWSATAAPQAFAAYCLYVPVMGINGITEGFLQGVASEKGRLKNDTTIFCARTSCYLGCIQDF